MNYGPDQKLAARIVQGSTPAWHEFVHAYSPLILSVVRRYYQRADDDRRRDAFVRILEYLYREGLRKYDGRAALSTWVMTVSRSRCLDLIRARDGRLRDPKWLTGLSRTDRDIYRLYFVEMMAVAAVQDRLCKQGRDLSDRDIEEALGRIETRMGRAFRRRLDYRLKRAGGVSARTLEFMDHLRLEQESASETLRPDHQLHEERARKLLSEVDACVRSLDDPQRRVVELRFYRNLTAQEIARQLNLSGPRRVYTMINESLARLKNLIQSQGAVPVRIPLKNGKGDWR